MSTTTTIIDPTTTNDLSFTDAQLLSMSPGKIPADDLLRAYNAAADSWNSTDKSGEKSSRRKVANAIEMEMDGRDIDYSESTGFRILSAPVASTSKIDWSTFKTADLLKVHTEQVKGRETAETDNPGKTTQEIAGVKSGFTKRLTAIEAVLVARKVTFASALGSRNASAVYDDKELNDRIHMLRNLRVKYIAQRKPTARVKHLESELRVCQDSARERGLTVSGTDPLAPVADDGSDS